MKALSPSSSFILCLVLSLVLAAGRQLGLAQDVNAISTVTIVATDAQASETGPDPGAFTVTRTGSTNLPLSVFYVLRGTAMNGIDYEKLLSPVQIPAGAFSASFVVKPIDDTLVEGDETVVAQIVGSPLACVTCGYNIGVPSNAVVTIADNDSSSDTNQLPEVNIIATDPIGSETSPIFGVQPLEIAQPIIIDPPFNPIVFTVTRTGPTALPLTVFYDVGGTASNGVDYVVIQPPATTADQSLPGHVTIEAGSSSAAIELAIIDDDLVEGTETVELRLQPPICPDIIPRPPGCYVVGPSNVAVGYILDNDPAPTNPPPPVVTIVATDPDASESGPDPGTFTVSRTGGTNSALTVAYSIGGTAQNGIDYDALLNYVIIPAGAASADITVTPIDDPFPEGPETVVVQLRPWLIRPLEVGPTPDLVVPIIWPPSYVVGVPSNAVVTIADNDLGGTNIPPQVRLITPFDGARFFGPTNILLGAEAFDRDGSVTQVEFFEGDHSLGLGVGPLRTPFGAWLLTWSNVAPGDYTLTAQATDNLGAVGVSDPARITVLTNPPPPPPPTNRPPIVNIVARDPFASEGTLFWLNDWDANRWAIDIWNPWRVNLGGTNTATFIVHRHGEADADLTVLYDIGGTASNSVDYVTLSGSVTILAGKRSAPIVIVPIDDAVVEPTETVVLTLKPSDDYVVGFPAHAAAIIVDNDRLPPPCVVLPDHEFHFCLPMTNGFCFRIEASTDLLNWSPLCTNVVTDGALHFVDPDAPPVPTRFYRALPESGLPPDD